MTSPPKRGLTAPLAGSRSGYTEAGIHALHRMSVHARNRMLSVSVSAKFSSSGSRAARGLSRMSMIVFVCHMHHKQRKR